MASKRSSRSSRDGRRLGPAAKAKYLRVLAHAENAAKYLLYYDYDRKLPPVDVEEVEAALDTGLVTPEELSAAFRRALNTCHRRVSEQ